MEVSKYKITSLLAALALAGSQVVCAQEAQPLPLRLKKTVKVASERAGVMMVPLKCDPQGNIYVRGYVPENVMAAPVVKISPEGERVAVFDIRSAKGFEKGSASDFTIGLRGEVFLLGYKTKSQRSILRFHDDGRFDAVLDLEPGFDPSQVAVFPSGEFLISGLRYVQEKPDLPGEPFEAIFDRWGKLLHMLSLPDDVHRPTHSDEERPQDRNEQADANQGPPQQEDEVSLAVSLGSAVAAEDGHVYLMRATAKPLIFVVSVTGEIVRRLRVSPPGENYRAVTMKVAGGRIAIQFEEDKVEERRNPRQIISVLDAITGDRFADYLSPDGIGGAFACYTPNSLTFVGSDENLNLVVRQASP